MLRINVSRYSAAPNFVAVSRPDRASPGVPGQELISTENVYIDVKQYRVLQIKRLNINFIFCFIIP